MQRTRIPLLMSIAMAAGMTALVRPGSAHAQTVDVFFSGLSFSPDTVMVNPGDSVRWIGSLSSHTVTQTSEETWNAGGSAPLPGGFDSSMGAGSSYTVSFTEPGTYFYVCQFHSGAGMKGRVVVLAPPTPSPTPTPPQTPTPTPPDHRPAGDFDASGCTDIADFLILLDNYQSPAFVPPLGLSDFLSLLDNWNTGPSCP